MRRFTHFGLSRVPVLERRFLKLYSRWHETHNDDLQQKCVSLLAEILAVEPRFSLSRELQRVLSAK